MATLPSIYYGLDGPSLISPNGGESFVDGQVLVQWSEPNSIIDSDDLIWYEILFVDSFSVSEKNNWFQIARVPKGMVSFLWDIP